MCSFCEESANLERHVEMARELRKLLSEIGEMWAELPTEADIQRLQDGILPIRHCMQEIAAWYEELPSAEELDELNSLIHSPPFEA